MPGEEEGPEPTEWVLHPDFFPVGTASAYRTLADLRPRGALRGLLRRLNPAVALVLFLFAFIWWTIVFVVVVPWLSFSVPGVGHVVRPMLQLPALALNFSSRQPNNLPFVPLFANFQLLISVLASLALWCFVLR